jgi:MFS family permease
VTIKRLGEKKMTILGLSILVATFFLVGIFGTFYRVIWIFVILMVFASYGVSCSRGILISRVTQSVSPKEIGKINGYTTTLDSIAQIIGPILGTFLLQGFPTYVFGIVLALFAVGAFLMDFKEIIPFLEKSKFKETVSFIPE